MIITKVVSESKKNNIHNFCEFKWYRIEGKIIILFGNDIETNDAQCKVFGAQWTSTQEE